MKPSLTRLAITGGWGETPLPLCVGHEIIGTLYNTTFLIPRRISSRQMHISTATISYQRQLYQSISYRSLLTRIAGRAVKVGNKVKDIKVGDRVGVGAQVGADLNCDNCKADQENYCPNQ